MAWLSNCDFQEEKERGKVHGKFNHFILIDYAVKNVEGKKMINVTVLEQLKTLSRELLLVASVMWCRMFHFVQCWDAVSLEVKYSWWWNVVHKRPRKSLWQELENTVAYANTRGYLSGWTVVTKIGTQQSIIYSCWSKECHMQPWAARNHLFILFKPVISLLTHHLNILFS